MLLEAPAECPSTGAWFEGWGTGYQTTPEITDTSGTLSTESGSTVRDIAASTVDAPTAVAAPTTTVLPAESATRRNTG